MSVAWDGGFHAFVLDTVVAPTHRHQGIATLLVEHATQGAREAACEWLHGDFEEPLRVFYFESCGFTSTTAGLIKL